MAMGQNPNRTPSSHQPSQPLKKVLKWVVHRKPQNGTIGFDPQPNVLGFGRNELPQNPFFCLEAGDSSSYLIAPSVSENKPGTLPRVPFLRPEPEANQSFCESSIPRSLQASGHAASNAPHFGLARLAAHSFSYVPISHLAVGPQIGTQNGTLVNGRTN